MSSVNQRRPRKSINVAQRDVRIAHVPCGNQRFCETCAEVERQGRGCSICRTDIQMILRLF